MAIHKYEREPKKVLRKQLSVAYSIIGGTDNPAALDCRFYELEGDEVATTFTATRMHEGHGHMMHGGIIASLLDEVMGRSINNSAADKEKPFVTGTMTTTFRLPIAVGKQMYAYGHVEQIEGRKCFTRGVIVDAENVIYAEATGIYLVVEQAGDDGGEDYHGLPLLPCSETDPKIL